MNQAAPIEPAGVLPGRLSYLCQSSSEASQFWLVCSIGRWYDKEHPDNLLRCIRKITLLGGGAPLGWKRDAVALDVGLPTGTDQNQPAYALKIEPAGKLYVEEAYRPDQY